MKDGAHSSIIFYMKKVAFDNKLYLKIQREEILKRAQQFNDKLYLEFGGKLFDDFHASRVLPGFQPDSKLQMLLSLKDDCEIVIAVNANDINSNKVRNDTGYTYQIEVERLIDIYRMKGFYVSSVVINFYEEFASVLEWKSHLENNGIKVYRSYKIAGYPQNISLILSDEGLGKNDYIETTKKVVVVTAPGPGSGKMATCLSQLYHENVRGVKAGYAKYETFPVWNMALDDPINLAYEAATVDLKDINMIDPYHLEKYGVSSVNYNRDIETFPLLKTIFEKLYGETPYYSPTDMGVNKVGFAIKDKALVDKACKREIVRRYYETKLKIFLGKLHEDALAKMEILLNKAGVTPENRKCVIAALNCQKEKKEPACAIELSNGKIITGHRSPLLGASAALLVNTLKYLAKIDKSIHLLSPAVVEPMQKLKTELLHRSYARLRAEEILLALSIQANTNPLAEMALKQVPKLSGAECHSTVILSEVDRSTFQRLGIHITEEDKNYGSLVYNRL